MCRMAPAAYPTYEVVTLRTGRGGVARGTECLDRSVIPAQAGIQCRQKSLGSRLRGNDGQFYVAVCDITRGSRQSGNDGFMHGCRP